MDKMNLDFRGRQKHHLLYDISGLLSLFAQLFVLIKDFSMSHYYTLYCYNNIRVGSFEEREFVASFFFERCKPILIKDIVGRVMLLSWRGDRFWERFC